MARRLLSDAEHDIAQRVIKELAPEERYLFRQLSEPDRLEFLRRPGAVGYGIEEAVTLLSPTLLVMVAWGWSVVKGEIKIQSEDRLRKLTRRAFAGEVKPPEALTSSSIPTEAELRNLITDRTLELGGSSKMAVRLGKVLAYEIFAEMNGTPPTQG